MTTNLSRGSFLILLALVFSISGCQKKQKLEFTYKEVKESTLTYHRPVEFDFKVDKKKKYDITLEIVYSEADLSWDGEHEAAAAPLFIRLTGPTLKDVKDIEHQFTLQDGLGWRGAATENEGERRLYNLVYKGTELVPGDYTLAIFSNAKFEHAEFPIIGIRKMGMALKGWK